ncbi:MAG: 30S ribosomal protein S1 [Acidiferrobacterales bacterium]|nr:30S ribosomal protein S1 [Acidiferrobacterales bacterium]
MEETFPQLFEESIKDVEMRAGEIVLAQIVEIDKDYVLVNANLKSEAEIPISQFRDMKGEVNLKVGDEVEVEIESIEDGSGRTRLSRDKACRVQAWEKIETAYSEQSVILGVITSRVKGGFSVSLENVRAFLPGSLYGARIAPEGENFEFEKEPVEFKIIKLDRARNNVVISRKAVLDKELSEEREALLESLEVGQIIQGIVKNLTDYGAFINLGGIDGLLHITDLAWKRVKHPSDILTIGEEISVKVLKCDRERSRISLGLKQLTEDPWSNIDRRYKVGDKLIGKVTSLTDYGAFVEIEEGVKGLVHVSEMDWTSKNVYPANICGVGDEIEVMVLSVDLERHRISLGIKQCQSNPWVEFASKHAKDDRITGRIKSFTDFGIFVSLENGIDGLVHSNDITWSGDSEAELRKYDKGDDIEVVILTIDAERQRISLGIKQIQEDPFFAYVAENGKGSVVKGTVDEFEEKRVIVSLADGVKGMIRDNELAKSKYKETKSAMEVGQEVESKVLSIDRKNRKISLSIKALLIESENQDYQNYAKEDTGPTRTLRDKLKEKFFTSTEE